MLVTLSLPTGIEKPFLLFSNPTAKWLSELGYPQDGTKFNLYDVESFLDPAVASSLNLTDFPIKKICEGQLGQLNMLNFKNLFIDKGFLNIPAENWWYNSSISTTNVSTPIALYAA